VLGVFEMKREYFKNENITLPAPTISKSSQRQILSPVVQGIYSGGLKPSNQAEQIPDRVLH
jgi:hypothetical protein